MRAPGKVSAKFGSQHMWRYMKGVYVNNFRKFLNNRRGMSPKELGWTNKFLTTKGGGTHYYD